MEDRQDKAALSRQEEERILERIRQTRPGTPERSLACEAWRQFLRSDRFRPMITYRGSHVSRGARLNPT